MLTMNERFLGGILISVSLATKSRQELDSSFSFFCTLKHLFVSVCLSILDSDFSLFDCSYTYINKSK